MWFKLTNKTIYGTYYALVGAVITLAGNILLIKPLGYYGSALTALVCYGVMSLLCYSKGKKEFPIPYNFKPLFVYLVVAIAIIYGADLIIIENRWIEYGVDIFITLAFALGMYFLEGRNIQYKPIKSKNPQAH